MQKLQMRKPLLQDKKGAFQIVNSTISWVIGLALLVVIGFMFLTTLGDSNLLTADSVEDNATDDLRGNITAGVNEISEQIPTIFSVGAIIIVVAILLILYSYYKRNMGGNGGDL